LPRLLTGLACCLALTLPTAGSAWADNLTANTKKLLQEMNLPESVMDGLDAELAVPADWIEKAKKEEGALRIRWNNEDDEFQEQWELFTARYPFVKLEYLYATGADASTQPRLAYSAGNIVMDVSDTIGREHALWADIDGFEDLSDLPAIKSLVDGGLSEDHLTAGYSTNAYCISYNDKKVKKSEMPKTWDDLVANDRFGDGKLGLSVNMTVWLPYLVSVYGKDWGEKYMDKLFALKPQRRREGFQMISKLVGLGEFEIAIPQADKQVAPSRADGVPVAWHCPDPVPLGFTEIAIIKKNPRPYQSKLFLNWSLSRESQLAEYKASRARPGNRYLFNDFTAYPEETKGKKLIPKTTQIIQLTKELIKPWGKRYEAQ